MGLGSPPSHVQPPLKDSPQKEVSGKPLAVEDIDSVIHCPPEPQVKYKLLCRPNTWKREVLFLCMCVYTCVYIHACMCIYTYTLLCDFACCAHLCLTLCNPMD